MFRPVLTLTHSSRAATALPAADPAVEASRRRAPRALPGAAVLSALICGLLVWTAASASPLATRVVRSDAGGTELVLVAGEPVLHAGEEGTRVEIDGYLTAGGQAGAPELPGVSVLVAVPAGSRVSHRVQLESVTTLPGVRPRPVPAAMRDTGAVSPGTGGGERATEAIAPLVYAEDPLHYERRYPADHVQVSEVMQLRDLDVVEITVHPALFDPTLGNGGAGGLRLAGRIRITIDTAGGRAAARAVPAPDADLELYRGSVINPEVAAGFRRARTGQGSGRWRAPDRRTVGFGSASSWVKVSTAGRAFTRLSGADLAAAGVVIDQIDPASLRIFWGGGLDPEPGVSARSSHAPAFMDECAIQVVDGGTADRLDPTDTIVFLGQAASGWLDDFTGSGYGLEYVDHERQRTGTYWLTWGGSFGTNPRRLVTTAASPAAGAPSVSLGRSRLHFEQNRLYNPDFYETGHKWEKWWFSTSLLDLSQPLGISIQALKAEASVPGKLRLRLWGKSIMGDARPPYNGGIHDHYVQAWWNDELIHTPAGQDTFIWDGADRWPNWGRMDIEPDDLSFLTNNSLRVQALRITDPGQPNRLDESLVAWYQVVFTRRLEMSGENRIEFATPVGTQGTVNFEVTSVPGGALLFDVTDPFVPVRLSGELVGTTLRFAADVTAGEVRKFWVGRSSDFVAAAEIAIDASYADLRNPENRSRYLVIAHDALIEPAARLAAEHRTLPGESTPALGMAVRVSDVYDEFGWGLKSTTAIRNFIDYAAHTWAEDGRPLYVCLVGDASYDPLDHFGSGAGLTDPIPAQNFWNFIGGRFGGSDFISDDWYIRTFGDQLETAPDQLTDLYIGRIPARSIEEAQVIIDQKTIPFLADPELGSWRQRVILAADDQYTNCDPNEGFRHVNSMEVVKRQLPPELELIKLYLHDYPLDELCVKPTARDAYLEAFNEGAALVNYIGHGAPDIMAHEALFRVENTGQLLNGSRLPLFFTFSCTVNRFDEPGSEGIGEALVKHPQGGAIASTGATDLAFVGSNQRLNEGTFNRLFYDRDFTRGRALGAALAMAKNVQAIGDSANVRKYVLLGDPALTAPTPGFRIELAARDSGGAALDTLVAGVPYSYHGTVVDSLGAVISTASGQVEVRATDSKPVNQRGPSYAGYIVGAPDVFRSTLPLSGGAFTTQFVVPVDAYQSMTGARDMAELRSYAHDGFGDACGAQEVFLDVLNAGTEEPPEGPTISASFESDPGSVQSDDMMHIAVADPAGINIVGNTPSNSLFMRIDEEITVVMNDLFTYTPGSATDGVIDVRLPYLEDGEHVARIYASDNFLNQSQETVSFQVVASGDLAIHQARLYPNPFRPEDGRGTVIGFEIRETADVSIRVLTVTGRLARESFVELQQQPLPAGRHQLHWDGRDEDGDIVSNGVYLVKIAARGQVTGQQADTVLRAVVSR